MVKDSPHPHSSLTLGFLNVNLELPVKRESRRMNEGTERNGPELILCPVHLAPDDGEESLGVYEDAHAVLFDDFVELAGGLDVVEVVAHASAAFVLDADSDELGMVAFEQTI